MTNGNSSSRKPGWDVAIVVGLWAPVDGHPMRIPLVRAMEVSSGGDLRNAMIGLVA
jgi:hypothetical protein